MGAYHPGELAVQRRSGLTDQAAFSEAARRPDIPDVAAGFLAAQPLLVVGAADDRGDLWCSLLTGAPGFLRAVDARTLDAAARPRPGDPLAEPLGRGPAEVGALAVEPATRRRMRINGTSRPHGEGLRITTRQVYSNCPKYLQKRDLEPAPAGPGTTSRSELLSPEQRKILERADTFFVATADDTGAADANHRGGNPGFLRVHAPDLLSWPDYRGNAMFNTLGNLELQPRAGLLVPEWRTGRLLQITGTARVLWDDDTRERTVEFRVGRVLDTPAAGPLSPGEPRYSRFNPPVPPAAPTGERA
ncbi:MULTISPECIES: pyridoxamine 5'-phosphate oxidase family protein [unclassified Nocardiopsis]|uniref:pyridoxamine 5'-phosphate oxidase family protein n=1 Tax=unclassified Nocardiopsis TaxID=2649073 RepID=UPI00135786E9|nr:MULTISPECIES: pyridoxamine 5'-phosphate oxidase family protein [unclassified Nocardiopsis]